MASETEPFIPSKYEEENSSQEYLAGERQNTGKAALRSTIFIHLALVVLYSTITALILTFSRKSCQTIYTDGRFSSYRYLKRGKLTNNTHTAPIKNLRLQYKTTSFTDLVDSLYMKKPSPNTDAAWEYLLENMNIRVSAEELNHRNQTSVELTEGGGYLAWLDVFHELHCIVSLA